jgi:hypothetical protein
MDIFAGENLGAIIFHKKIKFSTTPGKSSGIPSEFLLKFVAVLNFAEL